METLRVTTEVGADGKIHLEIPSGMPPGPAEVIVIIAPAGDGATPVSWARSYGLGREIWADEDAQNYVNHLRDEWGK